MSDLEKAARQALEALELVNRTDLSPVNVAIAGLRRALEQPIDISAERVEKQRGNKHEQPAQKRPPNCGTGYCSCIECLFEPEQPAQQEPVAWLYKSPMPDGSVFVGASAERLQIGVGVTPDSTEQPLYTRPQAREPLTDEQIEADFKTWHYKHGKNTQGIRWVDDLLRSCWKAAHGIKGDA